MTWESLKDALPRLAAGTPPPPWAGMFGASPRPEECDLILVPVPWDATVSYGGGTAKAPEAMITASHQMDLEDPFFDRPYRAGITMLPLDAELEAESDAARVKALRVIENDGPVDADDRDLAFVNAASVRVNDRVESLAREQLEAKRLVGVVGGDHSSPLGLIRALGAQHPDGFGILHVDAHYDLRQAYEGFVHSHASIMYNTMTTVPAVKALVQVGIRDYSAAETAFARSLGDRGKQFLANTIARRKAKGESWDAIVKDILRPLPAKVYVSFDIDGLEPSSCPSTGTPVPGGLSYEEGIFLIEELAASGRTIVGFDLCEVAPDPDGDEWDLNVGARVLYKLCGATLHSNGKLL